LFDRFRIEIYKTIKYGEYNFIDFIKQVYSGLHKFTDPKSISPTYKELQTVFKSKEINKIISGNIQKVFDEDTGVIFNKQHKLFEIYDDNNIKIDLSDNNEFMDYFFDDKYNIPPKKQVHLRRMLMGLTSYYPIDRSSISYMPEIVQPYININQYDEYSITKKINLSIQQADYVGCISSFQRETYIDEGILDKEKAFTTIMGVDTSIFYQKKLHNDKFIVIGVGNDFVRKGNVEREIFSKY
jgi:hypothetical protein